MTLVGFNGGGGWSPAQPCSDLPCHSAADHQEVKGLYLYLYLYLYTLHRHPAADQQEVNGFLSTTSSMAINQPKYFIAFRFYV